MQVVELSNQASREAALQAALAGMRAAWDSIAMAVKHEGENPTIDNLPQLQVLQAALLMTAHAQSSCQQALPTTTNCGLRFAQFALLCLS